jgi:septum formation protein
MKNNLIEIKLASKSPRRKELLELAGYNVELVSIDVEEDYPEDLKTDEIAEFLALKKAAPFNSDTLLPHQYLLTADSIVVLDGIVYGKPTSKEDAIHTLTKLSNRIHQVYTGVCIKSNQKSISFTEQSEIKFTSLSLEEINYYLDEYKPYDKAGSYGIQDWIGHCKVEWIKGTMNNIMGLPLRQVYESILLLESQV